ncbi:MAG: LTA synthase family protein [Oscillospiraceae bacterium]|nr:LTA synthase family protein [Oscillospiraceae bacterium]
MRIIRSLQRFTREIRQKPKPHTARALRAFASARRVILDALRSARSGARALFGRAKSLCVGAASFARARILAAGTAAAGSAGRAWRFARHSRAVAAVSLLLLSIEIGLISLRLAAGSDTALFDSYFTDTAVLLLNLLPGVFLAALLYFASGKPWIAFLTAAATLLLFSAANYYKIQTRARPFLPSDLVFIGEAAAMFGKFQFSLDPPVILAALYIPLGTLYCARLRPSRPRLRIRLSGAAAALAALAICTALMQSGNLYSRGRGANLLQSGTPDDFSAHGFIWPFIRALRQSASAPPEGYGESAAKARLQAALPNGIPRDRRVNVISIMLESFNDVSEWMFDENWSVDVYEKWRALKSESLSGSLITNTFGGGTIDTERLFLAGLLSLDEITYDIDSYVRYFKTQGYYTEGLHVGDDWYYNRKAVNAYLGFDNYYFLQDFEDSDRTDAYFLPKIRAMFKARDRARPYFAHHLSYQNHGGYYDTFLMGDEIVPKGVLSDESYYILNNYLYGIADTNERLWTLAESFRHDSAPVVLVIYGDHKAWLGYDDMVYNELDVNLDTGTPDGLYNRYATPYIIWGNDAARAMFGDVFKGDGGDFSPGFLMNRLFGLLGWRGDGHMNAMDKLRARVPVVNSATGTFIENGALTNELTRLAQTLLTDARVMDYYRKNHELNSEIEEEP